MEREGGKGEKGEGIKKKYLSGVFLAREGVVGAGEGVCGEGREGESRGDGIGRGSGEEVRSERGRGKN